DKDAIAFGPPQFSAMEPIPIVDRFTHPHPPLVIDVHAGGIDEQRLRGPQGDFKPFSYLEGLQHLVRRKLRPAAGNDGEEQLYYGNCRSGFHDSDDLRWREA